MPCGRHVFQSFGGTYCLHIQRDNLDRERTEVIGKRKRISRSIWCTSSHRGPRKGPFTSFPPTPVHLHSPHCWPFAGPSSRSPPTCPPQVQRTHSQWFVTSHVLSRTALFGQISSNFTRHPSTPRDAYTVFTPSLYRVDSVTFALIVGWRKISISSFRKQNRCWQCALPSIVVHAVWWLYNSGQKPSIYDGKREKLNIIRAARRDVPTGVQTDNYVEESSTWEANIPQ